VGRDVVLVPGDARQVVVDRVVEAEAGDALEVGVRVLACGGAFGVLGDDGGAGRGEDAVKAAQGRMTRPYSDCR
jgi:hypothetical protein